MKKWRGKEIWLLVPFITRISRHGKLNTNVLLENDRRKPGEVTRIVRLITETLFVAPFKFGGFIALWKRPNSENNSK